MKKNVIAAPAGMSGLWVEPWAAGEVYAVAADWCEASSPVYHYSGDGWSPCGRQVADYRHEERAALEDLIRYVIVEGGDEPEDGQIDAIMDRCQILGEEDVGEDVD